MTSGGALRNEDFRKLLSTPAADRSGSSTYQSSNKSGHGFTHKQAKNVDPKAKKPKKFRPPTKPKEKDEIDKLYDESEAHLTEIMTNYRDRAAERRKGEIDGQDVELRAKLTSGLRAFREDDDSMAAADRREQEIRESKYLGGDIEHTHLVKGLDYSLLKKARSEIKNKKEEEVEKELDVEAAFQNPVSKHALLNEVAQSKFSRNICRTLFEPLPLTKNDLFQRGRMAYVVELEDGQDDVPVTLHRSNFEIPNDKTEQNINANNMLINKLSEVLSYLRSDGKKKRREPVQETVQAPLSKKENIFDDAAEYKPEKRRNESSRDNKSRSDRDDKKSSDRRNYFDDNRRNRDRDDRDRPSRSERDREDRDRKSDRDYDREDKDRPSRSDRESRRNDKYESRDYDSKDRRDRHSEGERKQAKPEHNPFPQTSVLGTLPAEEPKPKKSRLDQEDAYGELFPNSEMYYGNSDDEDDFSKMDMGAKKGAVNRWDFDSQEDYEKYMSGREAMPKAAFQFGIKVKAGGGRKTRKNAAMAEEKRLDREYKEIEKIWDKKGGSRPNY